MSRNRRMSNKRNNICANMKTKPWAIFVVLGLIACMLVVVSIGFWSDDAEPASVKSLEETTPAQWMYNNPVATTTMIVKPGTTVICVVACGGEKLEETLVMIKSALVLALEPISFIVITEYKLIPAFHEKLEEWREYKDFDFMVKPIQYPSYINGTEWRKIFKDCATLRLFLPDILNNTDAILYLDTDTVWVSPPEKTFDLFHLFDSSQYAGLAPECEDPNTCWYPRFAKHPYVPPMGVNSGVMLMNLTRMREFKWTKLVVPVYYKFKQQITWGDQDIINIIFANKPEALYIFDCSYNFRPDHCMYMPVCKPAMEDGAHILHGSRGVFHNLKEPFFSGVYKATREYHFHKANYELLFDVKDFITMENKTGCSKTFKQFLTRAELIWGTSSLTGRYLNLNWTDWRLDKKKYKKGLSIRKPVVFD